jgi:methylenetetrahydrofolate reductase (NADPH)
MKVTDHIAQAKDTLISFEVLPPLKGKGIEALYKHLDPLMEYNPHLSMLPITEASMCLKRKLTAHLKK